MTRPPAPTSSKSPNDQRAVLEEQFDHERERAKQADKAAQHHEKQGDSDEAAVYRAQADFHGDRADEIGRKQVNDFRDDLQDIPTGEAKSGAAKVNGRPCRKPKL
ncbi:hypothetical protein [Achromobacter dolens]|uniref:hypothetical protein n=1 Tax=Achromobacter dolens TaxID=1287738 RepID=UPI0031E3CBBC